MFYHITSLLRSPPRRFCYACLAQLLKLNCNRLSTSMDWNNAIFECSSGILMQLAFSRTTSDYESSLLYRKTLLLAFYWYNLGQNVGDKFTITIKKSKNFRIFIKFPNFLRHFPKIHRSVLRKITIDLLYFWDVFNVNLSEKNFDKSTAYSCRADTFI